MSAFAVARLLLGKLAIVTDDTQALYLVIDPLIGAEKGRINSLVLAARMATMHGSRELARSGRSYVLRASYPGNV
jgi:hypothetical protein